MKLSQGLIIQKAKMQELSSLFMTPVKFHVKSHKVDRFLMLQFENLFEKSNSNVSDGAQELVLKSKYG